MTTFQENSISGSQLKTTNLLDQYYELGLDDPNLERVFKEGSKYEIFETLISLLSEEQQKMLLDIVTNDELDSKAMINEVERAFKQ